MSKLNDQRVAITKRIMETKDARKLEAIARYLDGGGQLEFTDEELAEFENIRRKHLAGDGRSAPWSKLHRQLRRELRP